MWKTVCITSPEVINAMFNMWGTGAFYIKILTLYLTWIQMMTQPDSQQDSPHLSAPPTDNDTDTASSNGEDAALLLNYFDID